VAKTAARRTTLNLKVVQLQNGRRNAAIAAMVGYRGNGCTLDSAATRTSSSVSALLRIVLLLLLIWLRCLMMMMMMTALLS